MAIITLPDIVATFVIGFLVGVSMTAWGIYKFFYRR